MSEILDLTVSNGFMAMIVRFLLCTFVNWFIVDRLYYPKSKRRDFYFTFMLIGMAIFFLVFFMMFELEDMKGKTGIGVGIGLFGIFSIMRYRTDTMPVREMTYMFTIISLSVVHALDAKIPELIITNLIFVVAFYIFESMLKVKNSKLIQYDRIELATPERYEELMEDLKKRTGLDIIKVEIGGMDMLKDSVVLKVFYNPPVKESSNSVNSQFKIRKSQWRDI